MPRHALLLLPVVYSLFLSNPSDDLSHVCTTKWIPFDILLLLLFFCNNLYLNYPFYRKWASSDEEEEKRVVKSKDEKQCVIERDTWEPLLQPCYFSLLIFWYLLPFAKAWRDTGSDSEAEESPEKQRLGESGGNFWWTWQSTQVARKDRRSSSPVHQGICPIYTIFRLLIEKSHGSCQSTWKERERVCVCIYMCVWMRNNRWAASDYCLYNHGGIFFFICLFVFAHGLGSLSPGRCNRGCHAQQKGFEERCCKGTPKKDACIVSTVA